MASLRIETRLRITGGLLIVVLAAVSLLMIWSQPPEAWYRTLAIVAFAVALVLGVTIVVGKTRTGRMVLTRRRWKYGLLIGIVVVFTGVAIFFNSPGGNVKGHERLPTSGQVICPLVASKTARIWP